MMPAALDDTDDELQLGGANDWFWTDAECDAYADGGESSELLET